MKVKTPYPNKDTKRIKKTVQVEQQKYPLGNRILGPQR